MAIASGTTTLSVQQAELEVEEHQRDADADEGHERDQRREQPVLDQRLELVDVGRHPGHDPAGHLALVVVEREPLQLGPDPDPQRQHDPLGGAAGDERLADLVDQVGEGDDEEDRRGGEQHGRASPADTPLSMPVLTSTGPARPASASSTTSTSPSSSGRRNSRSSRRRREAAVRRGLARRGRPSATSLTGGSAATRASSSGVGARLQPPAAAAAAAEPGADARRADRPGARTCGRRAAGRRPSTPPRSCCRRTPSSASASIRSPMISATSSSSPVSSAAVERAALASARRGVPCSTTRPCVEHDDPVGEVQGRAPVGDEQRGAVGHHRRAAPRGSPPRCVASTALVASSRIRIRGSVRIARASAIRCRWPPDRVSPRSPTTVS